MGLKLLRCQIDVVRIVFQAAGEPWRDHTGHHELALAVLFLIRQYVLDVVIAPPTEGSAKRRLHKSAIRRNRRRSGSAGYDHSCFTITRCRFCPDTATRSQTIHRAESRCYGKVA
ncbi:hypothetical protein KCP78_10670 [Salmonella enterica subsp. enterica]|nr:hypothetical protein KCP78_10670 [Salmonella enterica subsp. enterica]